MSLNRILLAASVIAGLAGSAGAYAQDYPARAGRGFGGMLASVQLSATQQSQIDQIRSAARTQEAPLHAQVRALRQQIQATLFSTGNVTAAQITPLQQQIEALRQQADAAHIQTELAVRNVLTSEQLATASSMQARLASLRQQEHAILSPASQ